MSTDEEELLVANREFYVAFSAFDIELMTRLWAGTEADVCVHPGWDRLEGWGAIRASWVRIFGNEAELEFVLSHEVVVLEPGDDHGHVELIENLRQPQGSPTELVGIAARNSFRRIDGAWRMTAHVTSPLPV